MVDACKLGVSRLTWNRANAESLLLPLLFFFLSSATVNKAGKSSCQGGKHVGRWAG